MPPQNTGKAALKVITEGLQHELRSSERSAGRVNAHLFVPGWVNTQLAFNYFREVKGDDFDPDADVPWSTAKPAAGAWMPDQTIDYLFDAVADTRFSPSSKVKPTSLLVKLATVAPFASTVAPLITAPLRRIVTA